MVDSGVIDIQGHTFDMHQSANLEPDGGRKGVFPRAGEDSEKYLEALRVDFQKSLKELTKQTSEPVIALAYPFGLYTEQIEMICDEF